MITYSSAYNQGGTFYYAGATTNLVSIDSYTIEHTSSVWNGGMAYFDNPNQKALFNGLQLKDSKTDKGFGGALYVKQASSVDITNSFAQ